MERSKRRSRFRLVATAFAVAVPLVLVPVSSAGAVTITAAEDCCSFIGSPFSQGAGTGAVLSNPGGTNTAPHNVYSKGTGPDGGSLFYSKTIGPGATTPVDGTEYLTAGRYPFFCTLHSGMNGVLQVTAGKPVPRPQVVPKIVSRSLSSVAGKGAVDLTLRPSASTGPVRITVAVGSKTVATARIGKLSSGGAKKVSARLTSKGRKTIEQGRSVKLKATAVAEFGSPRSTSKLLAAGR